MTEKPLDDSNATPERARTLGVMLHHGAFAGPDGGIFIKDVWGGFLRGLAAQLDVDMRLYAPVAVSDEGRFQHFRVDPADRLFMRTEPGDGGRAALEKLTRDLPDTDALLLFLPTLRSLAAAQVARARKTPFAVYSGLGATDWDAADAGRREALYGRLERPALTGARGAIAAGAAIESRFATFLETFRTAPITGVVSASADIDRKEREVLYVGSLSRRKGVPELLEGWLRAAPAGWRLVVAGIGDLQDEVEAMAAERDDVEYLGYVEHGPALFERYARAAIMVLPSRNEGFPRVLLEAAAHGCALAATKVGGVPAAFDSGGYEPRWFEPGDVDGLIRAVGGLAEGEAWRDDGPRALRWFEDNFGDRDRTLEAAAFLVSVMPELRP